MRGEPNSLRIRRTSMSRLIARALLIGYGMYLTFLLLAHDPFRWVGGHGRVWGVFDKLLPIAHFISFFVLAALAIAACLSLRKRWLILILVVYSAGTEVAQYFMPPRTAEWLDWIQDVGGVGLGVIMALLVPMLWNYLWNRYIVPLRQDYALLVGAVREED